MSGCLVILAPSRLHKTNMQLCTLNSQLSYSPRLHHELRSALVNAEDRLRTASVTMHNSSARRSIFSHSASPLGIAV